MHVTLLNVFLIFLASCSHMKSGQHVYWEPGKKLEALAVEHQVSVQSIRDMNPNLKAGTWVFVPNSIGIIPYLRGTIAIEDYSQLGKGEYLWPVPKVRTVSSGFGQRWGKKHEGIDIPAPIGTPVISVTTGTVRYSDNRISGYGNMIIIEHANKIFSVYAHLDELLVDRGQKVRRGEVIARSGNTGRSTGPHLHFEIRVKDQARDPANFLQPSR